MARNSHVPRCALSHQIFLGLLQGEFVFNIPLCYQLFLSLIVPEFNNECATAVYVPKLFWVSLPKTV